MKSPMLARCASLKGDAATRYAELKKELAEFDASEAESSPRSAVHDRHQRHRAADLCATRGETCIDKGEEVQPGFLRSSTAADAKITPPAGLNSTGRRTVLAGWLTDPKNPLYARVMVNRIWHYHFGRGIVATPGDFGRMGCGRRIPSCSTIWPRTFVENGWSMKKMHRLILLSNTYQQSTDNQAKAAEADPDNKLLWRYNRHRMEAEAIRDSMLLRQRTPESADGWSWRVPASSAGRCQRTVGDGRRRWLEYRERPCADQSSQRLHLRAAQPALSDAAGVRHANTFESLAHAEEHCDPAQSLDLLNNDLILEWARAFAGRVMSESEASG